MEGSHNVLFNYLYTDIYFSHFVCFAVLFSFDFFKSMTVDLVLQSVCLFIVSFTLTKARVSKQI